MRVCQGCGAELTRRHQQVYCSNACQRAAERQRNIVRWLETGEATWVGGKPRHYVRFHVLAEQGGRCAICGSPSDWMGLPLTLVLDHIDGDAVNNSRENLRLVCPNCDSQLPTFKSRNRGTDERGAASGTLTASRTDLCGDGARGPSRPRRGSRATAPH